MLTANLTNGQDYTVKVDPYGSAEARYDLDIDGPGGSGTLPIQTAGLVGTRLLDFASNLSDTVSDANDIAQNGVEAFFDNLLSVGVKPLGFLSFSASLDDILTFTPTPASPLAAFLDLAPSAGLSFYFDLADLFGATEEGQNGQVTVYNDLDFSTLKIGASAGPTFSYGVTAASADPQVPDSRDGFDFDLASGKAFGWGATSDNDITYDISNSFVDANFLNVSTQTFAKEVSLSALADDLIGNLLTPSYIPAGLDLIATGISSIANNTIDVTQTNGLNGTSGSDRPFLSTDAETYHGYKGDDIIDGRGGADTLVGGEGDDIFLNNDGDTTYMFFRDDGNDIHQGQRG